MHSLHQFKLVFFVFTLLLSSFCSFCVVCHFCLGHLHHCAHQSSCCRLSLLSDSANANAKEYRHQTDKWMNWISDGNNLISDSHLKLIDCMYIHHLRLYAFIYIFGQCVFVHQIISIFFTKTKTKKYSLECVISNWRIIRRWSDADKSRHFSYYLLQRDYGCKQYMKRKRDSISISLSSTDLCFHQESVFNV